MNGPSKGNLSAGEFHSLPLALTSPVLFDGKHVWNNVVIVFIFVFADRASDDDYDEDEYREAWRKKANALAADPENYLCAQLHATGLKAKM